MDLKLTINNEGTVTDATALLSDRVSLTTERRGQPGKLEFTVMKHEGLSFFEGNQVAFWADDTPMFLGYVFRKSRDRDQLISVTAYDQIRYLKNIDTYVYEGKTAAEVIRIKAAEYQRKVGSIANTGYVIPARCEDMQTLMDIFYNALDLTLINTGELYVLYDDFGALTLRNIRDMRLDAVVSARNKMINYKYTTDIDTDTYNRVKLVQDNAETGKRDAYVEFDSSTIKRWGVLQLHEKVDEGLNPAQITQLAQQLLRSQNRVKRTLSVSDLAGGGELLAVRGGSSLAVEIPGLGDIDLNKLLVVSKCTHTFANGGEHTIDLDLEGLD